MPNAIADIAVVCLAVMGQNFILNMTNNDVTIPAIRGWRCLSTTIQQGLRLPLGHSGNGNRHGRGGGSRERKRPLDRYIAKHPHLSDFVHSPTCDFCKIRVRIFRGHPHSERCEGARPTTKLAFSLHEITRMEKEAHEMILMDLPDAVNQIRARDFITVDGHLGIVVIGAASL